MSKDLSSERPRREGRKPSRQEPRKPAHPEERGPGRPPGSRPTKSEESRERVLAAAARIFNERGYAGTTMRSIAEEAQLKAGSLYYYYPSKDLLIEAVLDMGIHGVSTAVYNAIAALPPSSSYSDRIRAAIHAHLQSVLTFGDYSLAARRVLGQVPDAVRRKHVSRRDAYGAFWVTLLEAARDAGEIRADVDLSLARIFILGAMNSALEWYRPSGMSLDEVADQFTKLVSEGLFALPPGAPSA